VLGLEIKSGLFLILKQFVLYLQWEDIGEQ